MPVEGTLRSVEILIAMMMSLTGVGKRGSVLFLLTGSIRKTLGIHTLIPPVAMAAW
jgi:hypothetical protein